MRRNLGTVGNLDDVQEPRRIGEAIGTKHGCHWKYAKGSTDAGSDKTEPPSIKRLPNEVEEDLDNPSG